MILEYFKDYLATKKVGTFNTDLFVSSMPDSPDDAICLYEETGMVDGYHCDYGVDWIGMQVMTRGSYTFASSTIWEIHNLITGTNKKDTDNYYLVTSTTQTPPAQVDIDTKGRRVYTAHYLFLVEQKTNENRINLT